MPEYSLSMVEFLRWISDRPRTYEETMAAWRSTCPRLTVWEDALLEGFVKVSSESVCLTSRGRTVIDRPADVSLRQYRLIA